MPDLRVGAHAADGWQTPFKRRLLRSVSIQAFLQTRHTRRGHGKDTEWMCYILGDE